MDSQKFISLAKQAVVQHVNQKMFEEEVNRGIGIISEDVFVVWYAKTLQNVKVILGYPGSKKLWEITYNGTKNETYFDEYEKTFNRVVKLN